MFHTELETERLRLRVLTEKDESFIYTLFSNEEVSRYLYDEEPFKEKSQAEEFIQWYSPLEERPFNRFGIEHKTKGVLIGTCGYHEWDQVNHMAEIGYDLLPDYWGEGYMNEALHALLAFGFTNLELNRIHAYIALKNSRSKNLLSKLNFSDEGIFRDKHLYKGVYYDHHCFSLLRKEWQNQGD